MQKAGSSFFWLSYLSGKKVKYLFFTIVLCVFALITKAQLNPYAISNKQVDSLHAALSQTSSDSLKMELNAIFSLYYSENDKDSAIYFLNRQLALATKLDIPLWKAEALCQLGYQYTCKSDFTKALQSLNAALAIAGDVVSGKGYRSKFMINIPAWFTNRECQLSLVNCYTAFLYQLTFNFNKASLAFAEAIRIAERTGDKESLQLYYMYSGVNYWRLNKHDSGFFAEKKALLLSKGTQLQYYTGKMYVMLGQMYEDIGDTRSALPVLRQSVIINRQQHNLTMEGQSYYGLSLVFFDMHQQDSAIFYGRKAQLLFSRVKDELSAAYAGDNLAEAYKMQGRLDSAYACLLLSSDIKDSIYVDNRKQALQFQVLSFNGQLRMQEKENERSQQQARLITYITLVSLGITFLILFLLYRNNRQRQKTNQALTAVRDLQEQKISQLDEAVTKRTEQLNSFRQVMATDFHDQTGNMLSAITRQAMMLKLKLNGSNADVLPVVESIITNSNELYDSSKDFLWNLNHNSDDPLEVFQYLVNYGQVFFNQFNIPFSSTIKGELQPLQQLDSFAALNLIYIFKESMTNVVKHAEASEVVIEMEYTETRVVYALQDNGKWKPKDETAAHYGLSNIERRCERNKFGFLLSRQESGTRIEISVPVTIDFIS